MTTNDYLLIVAAVLAVVLILVQMGRWGLKKRTGQGRDSYTEALRHLVAGETDLAYARLVETVRVNTANIDAYILLGDILRDRGNLERALQIHRDVTIRTDLAPQAHRSVLKSLARDYMAARRWGPSERTLNELDKLTKGGDEWARLRLLEVYEAQEEWGSAFELGRQLEDSSAVDGARLADYKVAQAYALGEQEEFHKARLLLKEALRLCTECADAYLMIGDTYAAEGRTEDAVAWWERLVTTVPERASEAFKRLEDSLYEMGSFERISDIYAKHLKENPENVDALLAMSHLLERKGEYRQAIDLLTRNRSRSTDPDRLDRALIVLHHQTGNTEKALSLALKVSREMPDLPRAVQHAPAGPVRPSWLHGGAWDPTLGEEETSGE